MNPHIRWTLPVSLVLISVGFWQNYVDVNTMRMGGLTETLVDFKKSIRKSKTKLYLIVSSWKIVLTFFLLMGFVDMDIIDVE